MTVWSLVDSARDTPSAYNRWSRVYDLFGALYTGGGIERAKVAHVELLEPGVRVLYLGAGTGSECARAARRGARVTIVDRSSAMLERCKERFAREGVSADFVHADARAYTPTDTFDWVVAPFFLNVLSRSDVQMMLSRMSNMTCRGGKLAVVDFRAPSDNAGFRVLQRAYYLPPLALFWMSARNAWHELYDYEGLALEASTASDTRTLKLETRTATSALGLPLLETLIWRVE